MDEIDLGALAHSAVGQAEEFVRKVMASWNVCHFHHLPKWLQDNDFLRTGHRPPLNSFKACFSSIFRVHTETGNIWTHLLGTVASFVFSLKWDHLICRIMELWNSSFRLCHVYWHCCLLSFNTCHGAASLG